MTISDKTGLPELPEGQFWRVENESNNPWSLLAPLRESGVYVKIVQVTTKNKNVDKIIHLPLGIEFAWGYETKVETEEEVIFSEPVQKIKTVHTNVYDANDELIGIRDVDEYVMVTSAELTSELIFEACEKALVRQEQIRKSRTYLGDYPPKNIDNPEASSD